jgi:hypothetical protein
MHPISDHRIVFAVLSFLFVFFPQWIQPVWGLFSTEPLIPLISVKVKAMKIPNFSITWITSVVGLLMLLYICVTETKNHQAPNIILSKSAAISEVDTNWEAVLLRSNSHSSAVMSSLGGEAWVATNYVYCAMFYQLATKYEDNSSWRGNLPRLYASQLAQNPTSEGYRTFNGQLDMLVEEVQHWDNKKQVLAAIDNLGDVELLLPISQREHISTVIKKIEKIKDDKWP